MTEVELWYNPYLPELKVRIDHRTPSAYSALLQYQHSRIFEWIESFFPLLDREINDDYKLFCYTTENCGEWISCVAKKEDHCREIILKEVPLAENIFDRLGILEEIGFDEHTEVVIPYYSDQSDGIQNVVEALLEEQEVFEPDWKGQFVCSDCPLVDIRLKEVDSLYFMDENAPMLICFCSDGQGLDDVSRDVPIFRVVIDDENSLEKVVDGQVVFKVASDYLSVFLLNIIGEQVLCGQLLEMAEEFEKKNSAFLVQEEKDKLELLCCIEPVCRAELPDEIFVGREFDVRVRCLPENPFITFDIQTSDPSVLEIQGNSLIPHCNGYAEVVVYRSSDPYPISKKVIFVREKRLIQEIRLFPRLLYMPEWGKENLRITYAPENAENIGELTWKSSDPLIATVDETGRISAGTSGFCKIRVSTREACDTVTIQVQPRIQEFVMDSTNLELALGGRIKWKYGIVPPGAYGADLITVKSTGNDVAEYRGYYVIAKKRGNCDIVFSMADGKELGRLHVSVK